ncbi:uncharacterized protein LOC111359797 isoform X2 [Spodoptera litura]|uniref:Uncharacterized protein LOC111359797 isoform X2 n=1 Tax=Spodoptera litura TaxID=69820 RepID=A0A9J7EMH4_SPOLT|nr:uncharacterized protein LOC111359797 isoform X2 [Spodoptera litura]
MSRQTIKNQRLELISLSKKYVITKMADDDEIDILGDFSFNSCFAQNNQGIPSCSNREDTVHPQWLLDSTETNWLKEGSPRKLYGNNSSDKHANDVHTAWSARERDILIKEMAKYGRNVRKISQTLKTKTEAEIQALIEAEYGVNLETPTFGLDKPEDHEDIPAVVQEEIVADDMTSINNVINMVSTGAPTINVPKKPFRKKNTNSKSLLKPDVLNDKKAELMAINPAEILYEDDLIIGSTESIGSDLDLTDIVSKNIVKYQAKVKAEKKIGNHRRKRSRNYDKGTTRNKSKELLKSPLGRQRKDSSLSEDSVKSPKMQIVLGSGQALPVSEGEQVIKIEKKKDSEPESDIEIDVDSDSESSTHKSTPTKEPREKATEEPIAVPLSRFEPMPKRPKKINLDGGGGYTIMHTEAGDLVALGAEPRRGRAPRKTPVQLLHCRVYNAEKPAPFEVRVHVSTLVLMDGHAHTSRGEVMGLLGGELSAAAPPLLTVSAYRPAAAAAGSTHCDMDPVSQSMAAESLRGAGTLVVGWHHSHPQFPAAPSAQDLLSQRGLQRALEWTHVPFLGFITSQHWPTGRTASQYRCIRVEDEQDAELPTGYQLSVKLVPDLTADNLSNYLQELRAVMVDNLSRNEFSVNLVKDICPQAKITYLEKCISSASHHMRSAGYEESDPLVQQLMQGIRDVFR